MRSTALEGERRGLEAPGRSRSVWRCSRGDDGHGPARSQSPFVRGDTSYVVPSRGDERETRCTTLGSPTAVMRSLGVGWCISRMSAGRRLPGRYDIHTPKEPLGAPRPRMHFASDAQSLDSDSRSSTKAPHRPSGRIRNSRRCFRTKAMSQPAIAAFKSRSARSASCRAVSCSLRCARSQRGRTATKWVPEVIRDPWPDVACPAGQPRPRAP